MKQRQRILLLIGVLALAAMALVWRMAASQRMRGVNNESVIAAATETEPATLADKRIRAGENQIKMAPAKPDGYNLLASGYMQKARETGDFSLNNKAGEALEKSVAVAPDNYDAIKLRAKLLLTFHRFAEARAEAERGKELRPDDHDLYGALTDAYVELGDYRLAVEAAQTMVDLRPDSASYSRVAYIRSLTGDTEGAIQAMDVAVKAADPRDPEGMAWYRVHLGDELMNARKTAEGEREYDYALKIFPDYPLALAAKARARVRAGDLNGAVGFYERAQARVPFPETAIALGNLYARMGRTDDAKRQYDLVEFIEHNSAASGTYSQPLALMWADHDVNLQEALAIMRGQRSVRQDIFTCDALAWVLFKNNLLDEAKKSIDEALRLGTHDARLYYHAGMIYEGLGDKRQAAKYLDLAVALNPTFDLIQVENAKRALQAMNAGVVRRRLRSA